ncbi:hypothetical protein V8C35DRAFT_309715 [Trichoderma chlorosporum]
MQRGTWSSLLSSPFSLSVHVKASSNHDIELGKGPWEMQAVPKAEGQLIILAASPACAPRSRCLHRHLDTFLSIDVFAVLETGDGISNPLMSPVLSATRVPETHIRHAHKKKKDPAFRYSMSVVCASPSCHRHSCSAVDDRRFSPSFILILQSVHAILGV